MSNYCWEFCLKLTVNSVFFINSGCMFVLHGYVCVRARILCNTTHSGAQHLQLHHPCMAASVAAMLTKTNKHIVQYVVQVKRIQSYCLVCTQLSGVVAKMNAERFYRGSGSLKNKKSRKKFSHPNCGSTAVAVKFWSAFWRHLSAVSNSSEMARLTSRKQSENVNISNMSRCLLC